MAHFAKKNIMATGFVVLTSPHDCGVVEAVRVRRHRVKQRMFARKLIEKLTKKRQKNRVEEEDHRDYQDLTAEDIRKDKKMLYAAPNILAHRPNVPAAAVRVDLDHQKRDNIQGQLGSGVDINQVRAASQRGTILPSSCLRRASLSRLILGAVALRR